MIKSLFGRNKKPTHSSISKETPISTPTADIAATTNNNINKPLVDKLPSSRAAYEPQTNKPTDDSIANNTAQENRSLSTDRAHNNPDDASYTLEEKDTIEEEVENENEDTLSLSANSSANFSFVSHTKDMNGDAYPALYNKELQQEYEKMKIEEEEMKNRKLEEKENESKSDSFLAFLTSGLNTFLGYLEQMCAAGAANLNGKWK